MFKRVEKRRLKKEEEEELGLDEDMKEILGMHDTDSEESASDSDSDSDDSDDPQEENEQEEGAGSEDESGDEADSGDEDEGEDQEDPDVTVSQALQDPVYVVSILPEVKACVVCPGKLLKSAKMVQLHRVSNAHERRLKQFKALAANAEPDESAWEVLQRGAEDKPKLPLAPSEGATSKRAEKKKAQAAKLKLRREKAKAKRAKDAQKKKALAATTASGSSPDKPSDKKASKMDKDASKPKTTSPPKKKRKVETLVEESRPSAVATQTASVAPKEKKAKRNKAENEGALHPAASPTKNTSAAEIKDSVKDVARSISDRAKNARQRAMSASKGGKDASNPRRKKSVAVS